MSKEMTRQIEVPVRIPTLDGTAVAETVMVEVTCTIDADTGDELLGKEAIEKLDQVKARYMGLLLPNEIRQLRQDNGMTQKEMSDLLQIGEKTYTRWESGRERPSRSLNLLLRSLRDGKVNTAYLRSLRGPISDWWALCSYGIAYTMDLRTQGKSPAPCPAPEEGIENAA